MPKMARRRLKLADLAILIAGAALSLSLLRISQERLSIDFDLGVRYYRGYMIPVAIAPFSLGGVSSLLTTRLIRPRPRWRAMFRQPGTLACLAILSHMTFAAIDYSWNVFRTPWLATLPRDPNFNIYLYKNRESGTWVAVAWTTLALSRAWRPEPSWIDRSGRVLGIIALLEWIWAGLFWE